VISVKFYEVILKEVEKLMAEKKLTKIEKQEIIKDACELAKLLDSKKGIDLVLLDVEKLTPIADVFLIVSSESFTHSKALEDYSMNLLEEKGYKRMNKANIFPENPWILLDYGPIIIHIFMKEARDYYELHKLWYDAEKIEF